MRPADVAGPTFAPKGLRFSNLYTKQKTDQKVDSLFGTPEAKQLEPLEAISDWLLSDLDITWLSRQSDVFAVHHVAEYKL